jgi:uncharacterized protein (DUF488 family)
MAGRVAVDTTILTIGHSTRSLEALLALLQARDVTLLADIRTVPRSRRNPQFNRETLPDALAAVGIGYQHLPELGGLRRPRPDSPNGAWRNAAFRGYADYLATEAFQRALERLLALAEQERLAVMCAEAVPWRCHRSLLADALLARGFSVAHIIGPGPAQPHRLTPFARLDGARVSYPAETEPRSPDSALQVRLDACG